VLPLPVKTVAQLPPPSKDATISPPHPATATEVVGLASAEPPWQATGSAVASSVKHLPRWSRYSLLHRRARAAVQPHLAGGDEIQRAGAGERRRSVDGAARRRQALHARSGGGRRWRRPGRSRPPSLPSPGGRAGPPGRPRAVGDGGGRGRPGVAPHRGGVDQEVGCPADHGGDGTAEVSSSWMGVMPADELSREGRPGSSWLRRSGWRRGHGHTPSRPPGSRNECR